MIRLEGRLHLRIASVRDGSPVAGLQGLQKIRAKPVTTTKGRAHLFSRSADQVFWPTRSASSRRLVSEATNRNIGTAWHRHKVATKSTYMVALGRFRSICRDRSELSNIGLGVLYFCRDFFMSQHRHYQTAGAGRARAGPPRVSIIRPSWFGARMRRRLAWRVIKLSGRYRSRATAKRGAA